MTTRLVANVRQYSGADGSCTVIVDPAISAANFESLYDALAAMSLGTFGDGKQTVSETIVVGGVARPTDEYAQRTTRFAVVYKDAVTGKISQFTIPCANLTLLGANSINVDLEGTEAAALVTLLEAHAKSDAGNAITVSEIYEVARGNQ